MKGRWRQAWWLAAAAIAVTAVYALRADLGRWEGQTPDGGWITAALVAAAGNYLLRAARWRWLLARGGDPLPWGTALGTFLAGFFYTFTPGKAGEVAKAAHLYDATGIPARRSLPVVWMERASDVAGVVALGAPLGAAFWGGNPWAWAAAGAAGGYAGLWVLARLPLHFAPLARRWLEGDGEEAVEGFRSTLGPLGAPRVVAPLLGVGFVAWALEGFSCWACLRALGLDGSAVVASQDYAVSMLAGAVSMIPGGLVATELSLERLLVATLGIATPDAARATLLTRLTTLWWGFPLGVGALVWVLGRSKRSA